MESAINTSASSANAEGVAFHSTTLDKLKNGFERSKQLAIEAKKKWEDNLKGSDTEFLCNTCGKTMKTLAGMKRHFTAKKNSCTKKAGYREVSVKKPQASDRYGERARINNSLVAKSQAAAKRVIEKVGRNSSNTNGNKITAPMLKKAPFSKLEEMLRRAPIIEVKKYSAERFHSSNASRKILVDKEIKRRK